VPLFVATRDPPSEPLSWSPCAEGGLRIRAAGPWTAAQAADLETRIDGALRAGTTAGLTLDLSAVTAIDTFGATLLERLILSAKAHGARLSVEGLAQRYRGLLDAVMRVDAHAPRPAKRPSRFAAIEAVGRTVSDAGHDGLVFLTMLGAAAAALARVAVQPRRFRFTATVHHLDRVGFQAIPIVVLITLLIGAIIAQQGIFHFRKFGADTYVVDLVGFLVLRELGVLVVAILVAGRSGSSYTAELGAMKMREEIDALRTMGLDPVAILILPRILALLCALPLLALIGNMAALTGGGLVAWLYGGMSPATYLARLRDAMSVQAFEVGMIKAPFMALVIGIVACAEGFRVQGSTESLGLRTTASVVEAIFMMIVLDAFFAVFFAAIGM
jgi:phospholipid/cholesterol/gamma-HCH transport system permease protein